VKVSSRARTGTRVVLELALSYGTGKGPLRVRDIAKRQGLSIKYVEQLIAMLKGAGIVTAERGVHGGYTLARQPCKVGMHEVFELFEGGLDQLECHGCTGACARNRDCASRDVWTQVKDAVAGALDGITLADLAARAMEKEKQTSSVYYI
jgi:Rrf2 family protein